MDILAKLRIVFWLLVLLLWGTFMMQFLHRDMPGFVQKISFIRNPFSKKQPPEPERKKPLIPGPLLPENPLPSQEQPSAAQGTTSTSQPAQPQQGTEQPQQISSLSLIKNTTISDVVAPQGSSRQTGLPEEKARAENPLPQQSPQPQFPAAPPGFATAETRHFLLYRESPPIEQTLLDTIETLHGKVMLDLISFSPWTRDERVLLYFFTSPKVYARVTGRPEWSGGASSVQRRLIYMLEEEGYMGLVAHELTHIYFDSFFNASRPDPLWLSEGMAVFIQTERSQTPPPWLDANLKIISSGGGFKLTDLMAIDNLQGMKPEDVQVWYAQSYSLVRFMMHLKSGDSFYQFCKYMRDGEPFNQCLVRSYGMPFNRVAALESVWRYDIKSGERISRIEE